jgi:pSer/pThr/pTyr-binding forkhead associated (FHA) protein/class 3 adenylate cyclase
VLEIVALEGDDAGQQFTIDGREVVIGRGQPQTARPGAILLSDPTVSSQQALIRVTDDGIVLEHRTAATNPTLVNGHEVRRKPISPGDRIQMGRVVLEVRARAGVALGTLTEAMIEARHAMVDKPEQVDATVRQPVGAADVTVVRPAGTRWGLLTVVRGPSGHEGQSFDLEREKTTIGRSPSSDVMLLEPGVSRNHAQLIRSPTGVVLKHLSETNPTFVDGVEMKTTEILRGGEEIQLADHVVLRFEIEGSEPAAAPGAAAGMPRQDQSKAEPGLITVMEEKIRRDRAIEQEFGFVGSFLDIDVVDSYGLKARASQPEHIILTFERFRKFAQDVIEEFEGELLNCNGDELMCFFESPHQAVRAASALLGRLGQFNGKYNLLGGPIRVRQGVHTGHCLVDRRRRVAYSEVLDVAGHLQKHSEVNGLLISEATFEALPDGLPFEQVGTLERESIPIRRLSGDLD